MKEITIQLANWLELDQQSLAIFLEQDTDVIYADDIMIEVGTTEELMTVDFYDERHELIKHYEGTECSLYENIVDDMEVISAACRQVFINAQNQQVLRLH